MRGGGLAGRDQPTGRRLRQPRVGAGVRLASGRRRRHRPRRHPRVALRHVGPARRRRPGAAQGVRHQQVPRRRVGARAGTRRDHSPHRGALPSASSPGCSTCGSTARTPWTSGSWRASTASSPTARDRLRIAVVRLPRISNATDVDALAAEPGVDVLVTVDPSVVEAADLVVLPGSRSTASDLAWLRERGLAEAVMARAAAGRPVLGDLRRLPDAGARDRRRRRGSRSASFPAWACYRPEWTSVRRRCWGGRPARGAVTTWTAPTRSITALPDPVADGAPRPEHFLDGWRSGSVWGTMWHGAFESDGFRRAWLSEIGGPGRLGLATGPRRAGLP